MNSKNMPKVSVIMCAHNEEKHIREAIDSVLAQTFRDFELIVVNDASTDGTQKILGSYEDPRVVILVNGKNMGRAESRNRAIKAAKGEYIAIMDADDISLPERFGKEVDFLDNNLGIGLVGSCYYAIDGEGAIIQSMTVPLTNDEIQKTLPERNCFGHGTAMMRRKCLEEYGFLYRKETEVAEDYDLMLRLSEVFELGNIKEPLYKWRIHAGSYSTYNPIKRDKENTFIRELARERREKGKDKLDILTAAEIKKILPKLTLREEIEQMIGSGCYNSVCSLDRARDLLKRGDRKSSFVWVFKAIFRAPFNHYAWVFLIESFIPGRVAETLKRIKGKGRKRVGES